MRSNTSEWSTPVKLIKRIETEDSDGFVTYTEIAKEIFGNFSTGVSRGEFYEAYKSGLRLSAEVECYYFDYENEKMAEINGTRYNIVRTFPISFDTIILVLEEVIR